MLYVAFSNSCFVYAKKDGVSPKEEEIFFVVVVAVVELLLLFYRMFYFKSFNCF